MTRPNVTKGVGGVVRSQVDFAGERLPVYIFAIRSMASGGAFT